MTEEEAEKEIIEKKKKDHFKVKKLICVALVLTPLSIIIQILGFTNIWFHSILNTPIGFLIMAIPFYFIEYLIGKLVKKK